MIRATIRVFFSWRRRSICGNHVFDRPSLEREQAARPLLDEQDDEDEDQDLAQHRTGIGLEELVGDAERQSADQRAPEIADTAEDHDHEAVDDVALAEIGRDVVDLAERHAGHAGNARAETEGERIDPRGADAHGGCHAAVLRDGAHLQAERGTLQQEEKCDEDAERKEDDPQTVPGDGQPADFKGAGHPGGVIRPAGWSARRSCGSSAAGSARDPRSPAGFRAGGHRASG